MSRGDPARLIEKKLRIDPLMVERKLVAFIKRKVKEAGADGVVVGLSGGVDSSVVASLSKKALGKKKVLGVCMPEAGVTAPRDIADAREVANKLSIEFRVVDISSAAAEVCRNLPDFKPRARLPDANIRPRIRMIILYYYANLLNRFVVGSGNRSELRAGYFTKFGDGAADLLPLGCLYKTQVKQLAAHLNISKRIIEKTPSAGLWHGQTDEKELGLPYEKLDLVYVGVDLGLGLGAIAKATGVKINKVKHFIEREHKVAHKLSMPEIPEL